MCLLLSSPHGMSRHRRLCLCCTARVLLAQALSCRWFLDPWSRLPLSPLWDADVCAANAARPVCALCVATATTVGTWGSLEDQADSRRAVFSVSVLQWVSVFSVNIISEITNRKAFSSLVLENLVKVLSLTYMLPFKSVGSVKFIYLNKLISRDTVITKKYQWWHLLSKITISNKCCSFELFIYQRILKKCHYFHKY